MGARSRQCGDDGVATTGHRPQRLQTTLRLKDQAVVFRTSDCAAQIAANLMRRNVPYIKFGGLKFLDKAHGKDLLSILRLGCNPRDRVAGFRVLQLIPGVGPTAAWRILGALDLAPDTRTGQANGAPPPRAGAAWLGFVTEMTTKVPWPAAIDLALAYDRILTASTRMPKPSARTSCGWSRSPPASIWALTTKLSA